MYSVKTAANQNSTDTINRKRNPNTVSLYDSLLKSSHFKKTFLKTAYFSYRGPAAPGCFAGPSSAGRTYVDQSRAVADTAMSSNCPSETRA